MLTQQLSAFHFASMFSIDLPPSNLGTKEHWDGVYSSELAIFEDIGDEGEIWFGEDSVEKMVDWTVDNVPTEPPPFILEIGTGNGNLLFALDEAGYASGRMCGLDYSADAVKLARAIARSKSHAQDEDGHMQEMKSGPEAITLLKCDFLREDVPLLRDMEGSQHVAWDLVLDKGTFDAMALAGKDAEGVNIAEGYPSRVGRVVQPGGYFLITSCNFTEEELKAKFTTPETGLAYHSRIPFPSLSFGGKSGAVYSSVAFQKVTESPVFS